MEGNLTRRFQKPTLVYCKDSDSKARVEAYKEVSFELQAWARRAIETIGEVEAAKLLAACQRSIETYLIGRK